MGGAAPVHAADPAASAAAPERDPAAATQAEPGPAESSRRREALELFRISKSFGRLVANDCISLKVREGEIVALLGENGAGKTTLMNILFGHLRADEGQVVVFGRELEPGRPRAAIQAGIGMVHQHFTLAANLTVLENIIVGAEPLNALVSDRRTARRRLAALSREFGLAVDPDAHVSELSVGERQRVEILKTLYRGARILVLDEPTAVLTAPEAEHLFRTLRSMAEGGLTIIFISHKLGEVIASSDRVVVLRSGKVVAERETRLTDRAELAELMVGRRVERPTRERREPGRVLLELRAVELVEAGRKKLQDVSLIVRSGEVLGIIGVAGNGQSALAEVLFGLTRPSRGEMLIDGAVLPRTSPRHLVGAGVARIPEDRHAEGAVGEMRLWENAVLERIRAPAFSRLGFVDRRRSRAFAASLVERFDIRGGDLDKQTRRLSGGNMQKLILGRNLASGPSLVIAHQPSRGLDEGAIAAVHTELLAARSAGAGVLLISEDLNEVEVIADRIQVMFKGALSAPFATGSVGSRRIGMMMAGIWEEGA